MQSVEKLLSMDNPYKQSIIRNLPRILALFNRDQTSPMYGVGDRYHWAWKLIDFGNGTFQGAAHGFSRMLVSGLLPDYMSEYSAIKRIEEMFLGADRLRRKNGSMEEAFPFESSFCVTALVAYDLLSAVELLDTKIDVETRRNFIAIVQPMVRFLCRAKETHAFISNHLATAAAALFKWQLLTGDSGKNRGKDILQDILSHQSDEGWFLEYEGADPGYQSLCTYYLADIHRMRPDLELLEPLKRSIRFLWNFAHPDGSFGGLYGSRNTRFYYPAGIEYLVAEIPEARVLADFMRISISQQTTVTLDAMDEPNLMPMFNAYCWAATTYKEQSNNTPNNTVTNEKLPALSGEERLVHFPHAGLVIATGFDFYTIISSHKGGVCYHFNDKKNIIDGGVVVIDNKNRYYSTQAFQPDNTVQIDNNMISIVAPLTKMCRTTQTPFRLLMLRLLNVTLMRNEKIGNLVKNTLVRFLITGKKKLPNTIRRTIMIGAQCEIQDEWLNKQGDLTFSSDQGDFVAIHMASQGYWQRQDDSP